MGSSIFKLIVFRFLTVFIFSTVTFAGEQPVAIFHAFDQPYLAVEAYVCELQNQGYSHIQIAPAQKSNPSERWWGRYQPIDYTVIEGMGSENDLKTLIDKAHACGVKVIADVVFNHMANMPEYRDLNFPGISKENFHPHCPINYSVVTGTRRSTAGLANFPTWIRPRKPYRLFKKST